MAPKEKNKTRLRATKITDAIRESRKRSRRGTYEKCVKGGGKRD